MRVFSWGESLTLVKEKKKMDEILIFGSFLVTTSILACTSLKSTFSGRPCFITSLWRHTIIDFHDFGINGKRTPYFLLWYQTTINYYTLGVSKFKFTGVVTTPLQKDVLQKKLRKTRVKVPFNSALPRWMEHFHLSPNELVLLREWKNKTKERKEKKKKKKHSFFILYNLYRDWNS